MKPITTILASVSLLVITSSAAHAADASEVQPTGGLNMFCDPVGTFYLGGTPLFDESTGERLSREDYLSTKGLNIYCDAIDTVYAGGNPLFDEETGEVKSLEDYLRTKVL